MSGERPSCRSASKKRCRGTDVVVCIKGPIHLLRSVEQFLRLLFGIRGVKTYADVDLYESFSTTLTAGRKAQACYCDGEIIDKGETVEEGRKASGEPKCTRWLHMVKVLVEKGGIMWPLAVDHEWVYKPDPQEFVRIIRFHQGEVVDIESVG